MPLTPHKMMMALRAAGVVAGLCATAALAGPFHYADLGLPFPDIVAHGLLFYGLSMLMFSSLPRSRTADLAVALLVVGIISELVQALVGREMSLADFAGDAVGVTLAFLPAYLAQFRALVREHPHATFAELRRMDRRRDRAQQPSPADLTRT